jgi:hypothetical protein
LLQLLLVILQQDSDYRPFYNDNSNNKSL